MESVTLTQTDSNNKVSTWSLALEVYMKEKDTEDNNEWHGTLVLSSSGYNNDGVDKMAMGFMFAEEDDNLALWDGMKVTWNHDYYWATETGHVFTAFDVYSSASTDALDF